ALHCPARGLFISGDMLLPRISTNISVYVSDPESDPLGLFMASLDQMHHLPSTTLVLPSHGRPFGGPQTTHGCVQERIAQLKNHHHQRLDELQAAASQQPMHAYEALGLLFKRKLDLHQTTFAMGESIAHLNHLWHTGRLTRARNDQGVFVFAAS
ncbi:MAG: MBL fold metallo-hydrolase, partial [Proteobacteria bacterium]|nr:MBL fold metallo-hydrolase [Pseudomonadota bacterium]